MIARLIALLSMLAWLGCSTCGTTTCVYGAKDRTWTCGPIEKPAVCPKVDCSKRAKQAWPVCTEIFGQACRAEKPILKCFDPSVPRGQACYAAVGVANCTQLWEYTR